MSHGFFFFQAEDGIRDLIVTGVQTCALPICASNGTSSAHCRAPGSAGSTATPRAGAARRSGSWRRSRRARAISSSGIGRAAGRGRGEISGGAGSFKKKKKDEQETDRIVISVA